MLEVVEGQQPEGESPQRYDFVEGVRGLLNEMTPLDETLDVMEALSQRIARTLGFAIKSFTALLSPKSDWSEEDKGTILPFAQIATEVLHRLGGEYAELAQLVERDARGQTNWIQPIEPAKLGEEEIEFPIPEEFSFMTAQLVEASDDRPWPPPLQAEEYTFATIAVATPPSTDRTLTLEPFSFKVGHLGQQVDRGWVVQKIHGQAMGFIEKLDERINLEMVEIPGGTFKMGSPRNEKDSSASEKPQHSVTIPGFYMGRYPVTQAQWRSVAALPQIERSLDPEPSRFKGDTRPVEWVSWEDAMEFCARLSQQTQREYRLPTEAEWEYACRAGTTTPFHFGETISPELANYDGRTTYKDGPTGEYRQKTTPVDHFDVANAWGLCDMHGNVREWCQDHLHEDYKGAPNDGSAWVTDNPKASRIIRGGSWDVYPGLCRSAYRVYGDPGDRCTYLGFRLSCSSPRGLRDTAKAM